MAPLRVGVASVRAGSGATGFAAALAWSSARDRGTMLVDADGAGGTVAYKEGSLVQFAATTSADLRSILTDETGTGPKPKEYR